MIVLGLAGQAGVGKDTVADYLVKAYGFVKFAFSDALYAEVQAAFGLENQDLLRDRATKEQPTERLSLQNCQDAGFVFLVRNKFLFEESSISLDCALSPRVILQLWGTEYRRAGNPHYWLEKNEDWLDAVARSFQYPEQAPQHFVNTTVRFENEREWIQTGAWDYRWRGNVWHIHRQSVDPVAAHVSETPLAVLKGEREIYNNDSVARLHRAVDLLMQTQARFVKVMPMAPYEVPEVIPYDGVANREQFEAEAAHAALAGDWRK